MEPCQFQLLVTPGLNPIVIEHQILIMLRDEVEGLGRVVGRTTVQEDVDKLTIAHGDRAENTVIDRVGKEGTFS